MSKTQSNGQDGAVSIFLVIFFALLLSVITVSFTSLVMRNTVQAFNADLSRSAYDSAEAGVEDAKRAIVQTVSACNSGGACDQMKSWLNGGVTNDCRSFLNFQPSLNPGQTGSEVKVQTGTDSGFDQAYTCVNVTLNTTDYINNKTSYQSDVVPIDTTTTFNDSDGLRLSWYTHADGSLDETASFKGRQPNTLSLPAQDQWDRSNNSAANGTTPAILRVESIVYPKSGNFSNADLENAERTLYLYPWSSGGNNMVYMPANRDTSHSAPTPDSKNPLAAVNCGGTGEYACHADITFPGFNSANSTMLLRVTPIYRNATFRIQFTNSDLRFNGVQPLVDSTGRAGDLYRRVQARVRMQNNVTWPEFAVDSQNSFCKDFSVGADVSDFTNRCGNN